MYKGDGSYKPVQHKPEICLLDLLNKEQEHVAKLNSAYRALEVVKKSSMRTAEYEQDIHLFESKLADVRNEIKEYCDSKLGVKTDLVDWLYDDSDDSDEA